MLNLSIEKEKALLPVEVLGSKTLLLWSFPIQNGEQEAPFFFFIEDGNLSIP